MRRLDRNHANYLGLLLGFGFGQGSALAAGTILLGRGDMVALASFGTALALASFAQWFADFGAVYHAGKRVAQGGRFHIVSEGLLPRLSAVCLVLAPMTFVPNLLFSLEGTEVQVLRAALLCPAFIWAFNLIPVLDGVRLSGISGLLSSLPWPCASVAMLLAPSTDAGSATVLGFAAGATLSITAQHVLARRQARHAYVWGFWDLSLFVGAVRFGSAFMLAQLPAQAYGRIVIVLLGGLGAATQGAYVYVKNIVNALAQLMVFARRIQYINLAMQPVGVVGGFSLRSLGVNLTIAGVFGAATAGVAAIVRAAQVLPASFDLVLKLLPWFVGVLTLWSAVSYLSNLLLLQERPQVIAATNVVLTAASLACIYAYSSRIGVMAVVYAELAMHLCQVLIFTYFVRQKK